MIRRFFPDQTIRRTWLLLRVLHGLAGVILAVIGYAYSPVSPSPESLPTGLEILTEDIPMWVWGIPWLIAAGLCIASSIMDLRPPWLARSAGFTVAICLAWSLAYMAGWLVTVLGDTEASSRGWVSAAIYGLAALLYTAFAEAVKLLRPVVKAMVT